MHFYNAPSVELNTAPTGMFVAGDKSEMLATHVFSAVRFGDFGVKKRLREVLSQLPPKLLSNSTQGPKFLALDSFQQLAALRHCAFAKYCTFIRMNAYKLD